MMEDFNAAMAGIEDGLGQASKKADDVSRAAAPLESMYSGLFRAAYNHLVMLMEEKERPWQKGALYRDFDKEAGNPPDGTTQRPDCAWTTNGPEMLSMENVQASLTKTSDISVDKNCKTMVVTFTASGNGWLTHAAMYGQIKNSAGSPGDCTVRLTNLSTGETEEQRCSFRFDAVQNAIGTRALPMDFLLTGGTRYRLEVTLDELRANPNFEFRYLTLVGCQTPSLSIPCTLPLEESALGGLALLRYRFQGTAGALTLNWDGTALSPHRIRTITAGGETFQEAEFRRCTGLSAGDSTLNFTAACPSGSNLSLFALSAAAV